MLNLFVNKFCSILNLFKGDLEHWFSTLLGIYPKNRPLNNLAIQNAMLYYYSQTCVQRPPLGFKNSGDLLTSGRCSVVIFVIIVPNGTSKWWSLFGGGCWLRFDCILFWRPKSKCLRPNKGHDPPVEKHWFRGSINRNVCLEKQR